MIRQKTSEKGFTTANGVGIVAIIAAGGYLGGMVVQLVGVEMFQSQVRFLIAVFGLFLAPLWGLYSDLKKLKDHGAVARRQAREIDHRVSKGIQRLSFMAVVFFFGAVLVASAGLWPTEPLIFTWIARLAGSVLLLSLVFAINVVLNMKELHNFETKLARSKQEQERKDKLLVQLRGSTKSEDNAKHHAI